MNSPTGMRGSRLASGSWNTIWKSSGAHLALGAAPGPGPATDPAAVGQQLQHGPRQGGLAAAGFADHAQRFAGAEVRDAVHGAQGAGLANRPWSTGKRTADPRPSAGSARPNRDGRLSASSRGMAPAACGYSRARRVEDLVHRPLFHDLAMAHHQHPVAEPGHHAEIVGDEHDGGARAALQPSSRRRTWACTVTSSAVVGSSAISTSGRHSVAMAIITRWRMPPDISKG